MHISRLAVTLSGEGFAGSVCPDPCGDAVYMFGSFDQADTASVGSILALDEAILGIREDDGPLPVAHHRHSEVAAAADSGAFMFGVHPEQPPSPALGELSLYQEPEIVTLRPPPIGTAGQACPGEVPWARQPRLALAPAAKPWSQPLHKTASPAS